MNRSSRLLAKFSTLSRGFLPLIVLGVLIPLLGLIGLGVFTLFDYQYVLIFLLAWCVCGFLGIIPLFFNRKRDLIELNIEVSDLVSPSDSWTEIDHEVWTQLSQKAEVYLKEDGRWGTLKDYAFQLVVEAAKLYRKKGKNKHLAFSLPELLLMIEELSRRYRTFLLTHVPMVEKIDISTVKLGYDSRETLGNTYRWLKWMHKGYRVFRLTNLPMAVLSELRSKFLDMIYSNVSKEVQQKLKLTFLLEVISVSIELYSGRYQVSDTELPSSRSAATDPKKIAPPLDPVRICLVGQVSSGKSSLVNALMESMVADVDARPSTNKSTVYECSIEGFEALRIVDLPGLDGQSQTIKTTFEELSNSDLIIWVLKANQPGRDLDVKFLKQIDSFYSQQRNQNRRRPVIIGVLNQVDRLKPINLWQPPYDYQNPKCAKSQAIKEALEYNSKVLGFSVLIPLSLSEKKEHFNLSELKTSLDKHFNNAIHTQLNRRRTEANQKGISLPDQFGRLIQSGKSLFRY